MHASRPLDPETRTLYGESLRPPDGYVFDAGVATTFSLDFETVLAVPVNLSLFAAEDRDSVLSQPLVLLEAAERIADRLVIFADAGRILASEKRHTRLCALLERIVVEVAAPKEGVFHPKLWVLRFKPQDPKEKSLVRLLILSRNLTSDRSWDISLRLDGTVTGRPIGANRELGELLAAISGWALHPMPESAARLVADLAADMRATEWTLPAPFTDLTLAIAGVGRKLWQPEKCRRIGVVSPFCDDGALTLLATQSTAAKPLFIGRNDQIAKLSPETLALYERVSVLDDKALTDDSDERAANALQGLHAKIYVAENGRHTSITLGSGNATRAALLTGSNVEVYATLTGSTGKVGTVDELLGPGGFGRLTRDYIPGEAAASDEATRDAERSLDQARRELCRAGLRLQCEHICGAGNRRDGWLLHLLPGSPLALPALSSIDIWPVTLGADHGVDGLGALRRGDPIALGSPTLADVTAFVAFRLVHAATGAALMFGTNLPLAGLPDERNAAIFRSVIANRGAFLRYLMLLLSDSDDKFGMALAPQREIGSGIGARPTDDEPLLEALVKALGRGDTGQIEAIDRLMRRLDEPDDASADPIPDGFRELWRAFLDASRTLERVNVD